MASDIISSKKVDNISEEDDLLEKQRNQTIFKVSKGIESFSFNKSIANLYEFTNILAKSKASKKARLKAVKTLAMLMNPMTPHISEEIWEMMEKKIPFHIVIGLW